MNDKEFIPLNEPRVIKPICAVCRREVEFIRCDYDALNRCFHFIVRCHGKLEECDLPERLVVNARGHIEPGLAFATPEQRLTFSQRQLPGRP